MRRKMHSLLSLLIVAAALSSCVYPFEPEVEKDSRKLVVEGDILVGAVSEVSLSYMAYLDEKSAERLYGGEVIVQTRDGKQYVGQDPAGTGTFSVDLSGASAGDEYRLYVRLRDGREYATAWTLPCKAPVIDSITHELSDDESDVKFNISLHSDEGEKYFRWTFDEDWEYRTYYKAEYYYEPPQPYDEEHPYGSVRKFGSKEGTRYCWKQGHSTSLMFTTTKELSSNTVTEKNFYRIARDNQKFSILYAMTVRAESLSEDCYLYWRNMASNSENVGDLFAPIPSEMRGNIRSLSDSTELVLGYINVSAVAQKRIFVDNDVTGYYDVPWRLSDDEVSVIVPEEEWKDAYYGKSRMRPVAKGEGNVYYWAPIQCVDCRYQGGTKDKPSFWPNDHY